jgi:hypothetical protein
VTALVLPRLYAGWWPLLRALGIVGTAIGFGLLAAMARDAMWPVAPGADAHAWVEGSIVYLVAAVVAALLGGAAFELRVSSFAWHVPGLDRRLRREITMGGIVVLCVGTGVGTLLHGVATGGTWFLAIAAALGFTIGLVNSLSSLMWARFSGTLGLLLASAPLFLMPELARVTANFGWLWALLAAGAMVVATRRFGAVLARQGDAPDALDAAERRGIDARLVGAATPLGRASRDGADGFRGVRRTDLDWARALLHQTYGAARGGLLGSAVRFALATVLVALLVRGFFRVIGSLREVDAGVAATQPEPSGVSFAWFAQLFTSRADELMAVNLVAVVLGAVIWSRAASSKAFRLPISRRRLAFVVWLETQLEELAAAIGVLGGFVALGFVSARLTARDAWASIAPFVTMIAAVFTLLPLVRWMRLWLVDGRRPARRKDAATELQDPWIQCCYALAMGLLIGAAILLTRSWNASSAWLRAEIPEVLHAWIPLLALVPVVATRWLWLVELRRFYRRCDLA